MNEVSELKRTTEVVAHRDRAVKDAAPAGDPGSRFEAITLEQGITVNADFHAWGDRRAWVSQYQALPDLDADATVVAIAHVRLENEGWERCDISVEPAEPHFPPTDAGDQQTPQPDAAPGMLWARLSQRLPRLRRRRR